MNKNVVKQSAIVVGFLMLGFALYLISQYNYNIFHLGIELITFTIATLLFAFAVISIKFYTHSVIEKIGYGMLGVALIVFLHALTYKGLNLFANYSANLPTQLWISLSYLQSISILSAIAFFDVKISRWGLITAFTGSSLILIYLCFARIFPDCFIEGKGLTPFKIISEYIIIGIYLISFGLLLSKKRKSLRNTYNKLLIVLIAFILAEFMFTLYNDVFEIWNFLGHYIRFIGMAMLFSNMILINIKEPYNTIFNKLYVSNNQLEKQIKSYLTLSERLEQYIEEAPYGIYITDLEGHFLDLNKKTCEITGYSKHELKKMKFEELIPEDERPASRNAVEELIRTGFVHGERKFITSNNETKYMDIKTVRINDNEYLNYIYDVTEQKKLVENIKQERNKTKNYFETANVIFVVLDKEGLVQDINRKGCEILEDTKENIIGKNWVKHFIPKPKQLEVKSVFGAIAKDDLKEYEYFENPIVSKGGKERIISWHNSKVYDESGKISAVLSAGSDITELKKATKAILNSEARYRTLFEFSGVGLKYMKPDGTIISLNKKTMEYYPGDYKELIGKSVYDLFSKEEADLYMKRISTAVKSTGSQAYETKVALPHGIRWYSSTYSRVLDDAGEVVGVQIASIDITERVKVEQALKESQSFLQAAFDNSQAGIAIALPPHGKLRYVNKAGLLIRDKSEDFLVNNIDYHKYVQSWNILHLDGTPYQDEEVPLTRATLYGETVSEKFIIRRDNSEDRFVLAKAAPIRDENNQIIAGIVIFLDITEQELLEKERLALEAQLRNQQKLESIGTLASGVAHEINNPINGVLNYGQIIHDNYPDDPQLREYATEIIHETNRVSNIVRNLLQFSRDDKQEHSYASIEDIINATTSLIKTIIKSEQIKLNIDISEDLPKVKCRSQQIQQVIMNLLTNARDALNEKYKEYDKNKIIRLSCELFKLEGRNWIRVTVEDHGNGISKDIQNRIMDPFFTTKSRDKGTGLGLAISYGIVEAHHGKLSFDTIEGEYTKFYLDLPCDNGWELE